MNAVEIESAVSELARQPFDPAEFPYAFLTAFDNKATAVKRLRKGDNNTSDLPGGVLQHKKIHIAVSKLGQVGETLKALRQSPKTAAGKAKFILATDGETLEAEDLATGETIASDYPKFADHFAFFLALAGISTIKEIKDNPIDVRATGRLNKLYVELLKDNPEWATEARRPDMNHFMARLIFSFFAIPAKYQYRALLWGIIGVIVLRGGMIAAGAALVSEAYWVLYIFAAFLIATGIKMAFSGDSQPDLANNFAIRWISSHMRVTKELHGERFFVTVPDAASGRMVRAATPLFLVLVVINLADLVFAVDSVPAIFAITTDTFIVFTSNIMAILGLRALYFALSAMIDRFHYLKYALASILVFIGSKIFVSDFLMGGVKFPPLASLGVTFALIGAGIGWSLWKTRQAQAIP